MIAEFITNHVFMSSILLFGIFSVFMQWLMTLSLKSYVKASANMKTTKKKVMINLKNQFEAIYGMDSQVRNIAAYVDKYMLKFRFMGLTFAFWEKIPFLSAGVVTLIAVGTAFYTYNTNASPTIMIEILFSYGMVLACFFLFFHIFGIKSKKQQIQIQLVDYLENYLTNRVTRNRDSFKETGVIDEAVEEEFSAKDTEQDIQRLINLAREMDYNAKKLAIEKNDRENEVPEHELKKEIAVSEEESFVEDNLEKETLQKVSDDIKDQSDVELLEEFVQSFLA